MFVRQNFQDVQRILKNTHTKFIFKLYNIFHVNLTEYSKIVV